MPTYGRVKPTQFKGQILYGYTSLKKEALWSLRNLINAALGKNVAGRSVNFDPEQLEGKIVGAAVEDRETGEDRPSDSHLLGEDLRFAYRD